MTTRDASAIEAPGPLARWRTRLRERRERLRPAPLAFSREKKLLLGALALLVAIPFPMNEPRPDGVVSWAVLLLFAAAIGIFLLRTWQGRESTLPNWAMNVAGMVYLPIFLMRLRLIGPVHIARPMVELLLFGLVVRLYGMRREREKWHVAVLLFFLFIAAMATSVHPLILVYLLVAFVIWLLLLLRFLQLHLEETYPIVVPGSRLRPHQILTAFAALTLAGAIPFFAFLPRLRTPYVTGGAAGRQTGYATGFRDQVNLDVVGNVRTSPAVALRMKSDDSTYRPPTLLRGTTYDEFRDNEWLRSRWETNLLRPVGGTMYQLARGKTDAKVRIWLEPIDTRSLFLPLEALSVEVSQRLLYQDIAGGVLMVQPRSTVLEYRVGVASKPVHRAKAPRLDDPREPTLDRGGLTERIDDLARTLTDGLPPEEAAERIRLHLGQNMVYTLDFVGRRADNPIEDFLFVYHSGHCEYFATAMVLLLRSAGIPARLATGFMGAEFNPLEDYYIVRQSNAHAWVEAYLPDKGWTTFDPTPPAGRPPLELEPTLGLMLRQTWDYLEFRWDRYVMAYGFFDQVGFLLRLRDLVRRIGSPGEPDGLLAPGDRAKPRFDGGERAGDVSLGGPLTVVLVLMIGATLIWLVRRVRSSAPIATRSYEALRAAAARRDPTIGAATGPIALRRWLERRLPGAHAPATGLVDLYLLESYRGARLSLGQAAAVRRDLRQVRKLLRRLR